MHDLNHFKEHFSWQSDNTSLCRVKVDKMSPTSVVRLENCRSYPYININAYWYSSIWVDVDTPNASSLDEWGYMPGLDECYYESMGVPIPNIAVITNGNRFHCLWVLEKPMPLSATPQSLNFFHDVRKKLTMTLNGDPACSARGMVKNPFYTEAQVRVFHFGEHELHKLNLPISISSYRDVYVQHDFEEGCRNQALFQIGRAHV